MLMLGADPVALYSPPAGSDTHGWALDPTAQVWAGTGSLQRQPGRSDLLMAGGGGFGPFAPNAQPIGVLYLPPEAAPAEGMVAEVDGERYALSQVRPVRDPTGTGALDCWVAVAQDSSVYGGA